MNKMQIVTLIWIISMGALWGTYYGCHDGCVPEETRCDGDRVQICDHDEDWDLVLNCERLEPYDGEVCCWDAYAETHSCLLPEECADYEPAE